MAKKYDIGKLVVITDKNKTPLANNRKNGKNGKITAVTIDNRNLLYTIELSPGSTIKWHLDPISDDHCLDLLVDPSSGIIIDPNRRIGIYTPDQLRAFKNLI